MKEETKSFFGKVIVALITLFIETFKDFIIKRWNKVPDLLKHEIVDIISIVNLVKEYKPEEGKDIISSVIPGDPDNDENVLWLRNLLNKVLLNNNLQNKTGEELTRGELITIGAELFHEITGMPWGQAVITMQIGYEKRYGVGKQEKKEVKEATVLGVEFDTFKKPC